MSDQAPTTKPPANTPEEMAYFMKKVRDIMGEEGFEDMILEALPDGFSVRRKKK